MRYTEWCLCAKSPVLYTEWCLCANCVRIVQCNVLFSRLAHYNSCLLCSLHHYLNDFHLQFLWWICVHEDVLNGLSCRRTLNCVSGHFKLTQMNVSGILLSSSMISSLFLLDSALLLLCFVSRVTNYIV